MLCKQQRTPKTNSNKKSGNVRDMSTACLFQSILASFWKINNVLQTASKSSHISIPFHDLAVPCSWRPCLPSNHMMLFEGSISQSTLLLTPRIYKILRSLCGFAPATSNRLDRWRNIPLDFEKITLKGRPKNSMIYDHSCFKLGLKFQTFSKLRNPRWNQHKKTWGAFITKQMFVNVENTYDILHFGDIFVRKPQAFLWLVPKKFTPSGWFSSEKNWTALHLGDSFFSSPWGPWIRSKCLDLSRNVKFVPWNFKLKLSQQTPMTMVNTSESCA